MLVCLLICLFVRFFIYIFLNKKKELLESNDTWMGTLFEVGYGKKGMFCSKNVYFKKFQLLQSNDRVLLLLHGGLGDLLGLLDVDLGDLPQLQHPLHLLLTQAVRLCHLGFKQNQTKTQFFGLIA